MYSGIREEIQKEEALSKVKKIAPSFCQNCDELRAGSDTDHADRLKMIPVCDKFPDGIPNDPKQCCPILPQICIECGVINYISCHNLATGNLDKDAIAYCETNKSSYMNTNATIINDLIFAPQGGGIVNRLKKYK